MVLRETGASWLASMMRAEREPEERSAPEPASLLDGAPEPEMVEALERWTFSRGRTVAE
ncbi:hypothetical protein [Caulobacter sp. 602-1]|mgnify:CR=1 FL=1|uniref:hypothetical protein n=1 Tax=unclassified Caulobacter TaxID=2648921 RepID=UPI0018F78090|nr:hypothetical protein [Caulobacter sp. 602-1]